MFQFPTPLTPTTGCAGIAGVSGGGSGAGGKGAIDLPDFMTFAVIGAAPVAPGKVRQDPAGGGEAVPGGSAIAPPAGHPNASDDAGHRLPTQVTGPGDAAIATADTSLVTVALALVASKRGGGRQAQVAEAQVRPSREIKAPSLVPTGTAPMPDTSMPAAMIQRPPLSDVAVPASDSSSPVAGKRAKTKRDDPALVPSEESPQPAAVQTPLSPQPSVIPFATQRLAADDRSLAPDAAISDLTPATAAERAGRPPATPMVSASFDKFGEPLGRSASDIATPVASASVDKPKEPPSQSPSDRATPVALARLDRPANLPIQFASGMLAPAIADPAPSAKNAALTDLALAPWQPMQHSSMVTPAVPLARRPADASAAAPALTFSLAPIARMLDASSSAPPGAAVRSAPQAANVAAFPATSSAAALPAMPASVASFLASVGPRPVAAPLADTTTNAPVRTGQVAALATAAFARPAPGTPTSTGPAGQLFAEAIHAASGHGERLTQSDPASILASTTPATSAPVTTTAVVADRMPIDMTQGHWPAKMIERIEVLRDAADAQDTRIRLIPDALGAIDVAMKRDGDTVRVHLAADRPETRVLIAEAQPRLAELGEQRGLKIAASSGQTSGQAMAQDSHQQRGNPAPPQPARPASARAGDQPATNDDDDQRVA